MGTRIYLDEYDHESSLLLLRGVCCVVKGMI